MAFSDFRSQDEVAEKYGIRCQREDFLRLDGEPPAIDDYFRREIAFTWKMFAYQRSEAAAGEGLNFPILREMWKSFIESLTLLSHEPLRFDDELTGIADYIVCKRSPLGSMLPDRPFLLVGEAKNNEFYRGWGQALAFMIAVQKRDGDLVGTVYGIATNGRLWEFGKLEQSTFTLDNRSFMPSNLNSLMTALHFVFAACREQVLNLPTAA